MEGRASTNFKSKVEEDLKIIFILGKCVSSDKLDTNPNLSLQAILGKESALQYYASLEEAIKVAPQDNTKAYDQHFILTYAISNADFEKVKKTARNPSEIKKSAIKSWNISDLKIHVGYFPQNNQNISEYVNKTQSIPNRLYHAKIIDEILAQIARLKEEGETEKVKISIPGFYLSATKKAKQLEEAFGRACNVILQCEGMKGYADGELRQESVEKQFLNYKLELGPWEQAESIYEVVFAHKIPIVGLFKNTASAESLYEARTKPFEY